LESILAIIQEQDYIPDAIIGHFYNPTLEIVGRLKQLYPNAKTCVSLHELDPGVIRNSYPKDFMDTINGVDIIGFRSVPIKERFEAMYGNGHKSLVCWSGTPELYLNTPQTRERKFSDGPMENYLYVGQTIKRKFPRETAEGVHKAMGENAFKLTFVGSQDLGYAETKEYVDNHKLTEKVCFTGKVPREEIIKYYDQADCFILISRGEVFGLVYLEAMSRGCITIAGKGEGMEGIIEHGVNGFLCKPGDAEELVSIIKHINRLSAAEKHAISENARRKAAELSDYNVAKMYIEKVLKS
jgi:glycosyltransferase involved in cell wall biosynthesis